MSLKTQLRNKTFRNWVNGIIATRYLREGLFLFIDETVKRQHEDILKYLKSNSQKCNTCSLNYIQSKHSKNETGTCPLNCRCYNCADVSFRPPCPKGFCSKIYDKIILQHRYSSPNWNNTDIKQWCSSHWEIAKCFMSTGCHGSITSASKADCSSLISVIINDTVLQDVLSSKRNPPHDIFTKVQRTINAICNSPNQELDDCTLAIFIDNILVILDNESLRNRPETILARDKLKQLKTDITIEDTTECSENTMKTADKSIQKPRKYSEFSHSSSSVGYHSLPFTPESSPSSSRRDSVLTTSGMATWAECILHKDLGMAYELLEKRVLPSNRELEACLCFGRTSDIFLKICESISSHIKSCSKNFLAVSAKYCYKNYKNDLNRDIHVVFVAIVNEDPIGIDIFDYHIYARRITEMSREDTTLLKKEVDSETIPVQETTLDRLRQCIVKKSDDLMRMHSNLCVIMPSFLKSVGYESDQHCLTFKPCVRLYVPIKGYIPLEEEPFPEEIDGFPTDVVEGEYEAFNGRPNDFHQHLKIGVAIHANVVDNNQQIIGGTLTGFVDHPTFGLCGMTSAHVLYSPYDLARMKQMNVACCNDKLVFQPVTGTTQSFGRVVQITISEGKKDVAGMEVALFQVHDRHPKDGSFPEASNYEQAGFDETNPLTFHSGDVCETSEIRQRTEVYKFGISSGVTRGSFALQGAMIRKREMIGQVQGLGYCLKNQIEILQIGEEPFATHGDSGALVLKEGEPEDSVAVGIVEGGLRGRIFATPICDVLRAVGCINIVMKRFSKLNRSRQPYTGKTSGDSGLGELMEVSDE